MRARIARAAVPCLVVFGRRLVSRPMPEREHGEGGHREQRIAPHQSHRVPRLQSTASSAHDQVLPVQVNVQSRRKELHCQSIVRPDKSGRTCSCLNPGAIEHVTARSHSHHNLRFCCIATTAHRWNRLRRRSRSTISGRRDRGRWFNRRGRCDRGCLPAARDRQESSQ